MKNAWSTHHSLQRGRYKAAVHGNKGTAHARLVKHTNTKNTNCSTRNCTQQVRLCSLTFSSIAFVFEPPASGFLIIVNCLLYYYWSISPFYFLHCPQFCIHSLVKWPWVFWKELQNKKQYWLNRLWFVFHRAMVHIRAQLLRMWNEKVKKHWLSPLGCHFGSGFAVMLLFCVQTTMQVERSYQHKQFTVNEVLLFYHWVLHSFNLALAWFSVISD